MIETGFPTYVPAKGALAVTRLLEKLDIHRELIESFDTVQCEDADVVITAFGITSRAARRAVSILRGQGIKAGLFRPQTLWPFPEQAFLTATGNAKTIVVAEMNAGQLVLEIERIIAGNATVVSACRYDGEVVSPGEIEAKVTGAVA